MLNVYSVKQIRMIDNWINIFATSNPYIIQQQIQQQNNQRSFSFL